MQQKKEIIRAKKARPAIQAATPHQLVGMAYDLAIIACGREEASRSEKAILMLRNVMREVGPQDSSDLMKFYDLCLQRIRQGEFTIVGQTLTELRRAWEKTEQLFPG